MYGNENKIKYVNTTLLESLEYIEEIKTVENKVVKWKYEIKCL